MANDCCESRVESRASEELYSNSATESFIQRSSRQGRSITAVIIVKELVRPPLNSTYVAPFPASCVNWYFAVISAIVKSQRADGEARLGEHFFHLESHVVSEAMHFELHETNILVLLLQLRLIFFFWNHNLSLLSCSVF